MTDGGYMRLAQAQARRRLEAMANRRRQVDRFVGWMAVGITLFIVGTMMIVRAHAQDYRFGELEACETPAAYIAKFKQHRTLQSARVFNKAETAKLVGAVWQSTDKLFDVDTVAVVYTNRDIAIVVFGKGGVVCQFLQSDTNTVRAVITSALGMGV